MRVLAGVAHGLSIGLLVNKQRALSKRCVRGTRARALLAGAD